MVLKVPKGLRAEAYQRERLWALKIDFLKFWNIVCIHIYVHVHACMLHAYA